MDNFIVKQNNFQCEGENFEFNDPHHEHVITGDLSIVGYDLLKLMQQGPSFREQSHILSRKQIIKGLKRDIKQG